MNAGETPDLPQDSNTPVKNDAVELTTFTMPTQSTADAQFKLPKTVGGGKAEAPSKTKLKNDLLPNSQEYIKRRNRNNVAVKKSREKSKQKGSATSEGIERLKVENAELEDKVEYLSKELSVLKKAFMDHARGFSGGDSELPDLKQLESLLGHKLTDKTASSITSESSDKPSTSNDKNR